ncbi:hypothetical protein [Solimonas fluminis]|uniref:hypothetical protein n=1 Tax=Solimonas fluminis TaxID=2086571 RepID=UPI0010570BE5|nr:hypothetical protein [Solimonas fluminis]
MHLCLHPDSGELELRAVLPEHVAEALAIQLERIADKVSRDALFRRVSTVVADAVAHTLDFDLQPPTDRQVRFAGTIARHLGVDIPADVFRFRGPMTRFLDKHAPTFHARVSRRSGSATPDDAADIIGRRWS